MAMILQFRALSSSLVRTSVRAHGTEAADCPGDGPHGDGRPGDRRPRDGQASAEIVIFPGVRYERHTEPRVPEPIGSDMPPDARKKSAKKKAQRPKLG